MLTALLERAERGFERALARSAALARRRAAFTLLVALTATGLAGWYAAATLGLNVSTENMIAAEVPFRQHALEYGRAFPETGQVVLLVVDGRTPEAAEAAAETLAAALRRRPDVIESVEVPTAEPFFRTHGLLYLGLDALYALSERLAGAQAFLATMAADPSLRGLADVLALAADDPDARANAPPEFATLLRAFAATAAAEAEGRPAPSPWAGSLLGTTPDRLGPRRFVLVEPRLDDATLARARPALAAIRATVDGLRRDAAVGGDVRVRATGAPVLRQAELDAVASGAVNASLASLVLVAVVLAAGVRSGRLIAAVLITLLVGLVWTTGVAALTVGELNLISVTFAVLFIGLSVDFGLHLGLRYDEERRSGASSERALEEAVVAVGPALALGAVCAAVGFLSFLPTDYRGMAELGVISGAGMGTDFLANILLLPALIALMPPRMAPSAPSALREGGGLARAIERRPGIVLATTAVLLAAALVLAPRVRLDFNPLNLQDPDTEAVQTYRELANSPEVSPYAVNVLTPSLAAAEALAARLKDIDGVGGVRTLASFVPANQDEKLATIQETALFLGPVLAPVAGVPPPDARALRAAFDRLRSVLTTYGADRANADLARAATDLARSLDRFAAARGTDGPALRALDRALAGGLPGLLDDLRAALSVPGPVTLDALPNGLRARWIAADGRARVAVTPQGDVSSSEAMRAFALPILAVAPTATGAPVTVTEASRVVLAAFGEAVAITVGAIVLLLVLLYRRASVVALVLAPLAAATLLTLATAALLGLPINFANIIVIPLLFGLGVASSIHVVLRGREIAEAGGAGRLMATSTPRAVVVSTLTTVASFATLAFSPHRGMASMGVMLAIAVLFTLLCTVVALPALMAVLARRGPGRSGEPTERA